MQGCGELAQRCAAQVQAADGAVKLSFGDLGGTVCLDELLLRLPGRGQQLLCVPETSSVSCDLRVFVDDTADQIAAPASERVEVSDGAGQWLEWCGLSEGAVRTMFVWWVSYSRSTRRRCR